MNQLKRALLAILAMASFANAPAEPVKTDSFSVRYEWNSGSVPPRGHWQYRVSIGSDGHGEIVMVPSYPDIYDDLPRWRARFSPTKDELAALFSSLKTNDFFNKNAWRTAQEEEMLISPS